jgi:probable F420-dependent oxidoreductase
MWFLLFYRWWCVLTIRVGIQIPPSRAGFAAIRRAAAEADALGADAIFTWDHFFPLGQDTSGQHFECWTVLGAWAESTSRAQIGALVSCVSYRDPGLLAGMARTVDDISGGRLILGLGAGFRQREAEEYGFEFGTPAERVRQLGETLRRIEPVSSSPVLVAADGPRALRLAARYADIWHTFADDDVFSAKSAQLDGFCREEGRDPAAIERSVFVGGDPWTVGPRLRERGAGMFVLMTHGPDFDLGELRRWLAWRDAGRES